MTSLPSNHTAKAWLCSKTHFFLRFKLQLSVRTYHTNIIRHSNIHFHTLFNESTLHLSHGYETMRTFVDKVSSISDHRQGGWRGWGVGGWSNILSASTPRSNGGTRWFRSSAAARTEGWPGQGWLSARIGSSIRLSISN